MRGFALVLCVCLLGCSGDSKAPAGAAVPAEGVGLESALGRLGTPEAFEPTAARPYAAASCMRGEVEGLDVLLCHYEDAAKAEAETGTMREFVTGALSGVVRSAGSDLMAVADRKEVDPKGERISRLVTAFAPAP